MTRENCSICSSGRAPAINRMALEGLGYRKIVAQTEFGERQIRRHLRECERPPFDDLSNDAGDKRGGKSLDLDGDTGTINLNGTTEKITDYTKLLGMWDLDPEVFEVIEPVRMSTWESGDRQLYSYRARIQKRPALESGEQFDISGWRERLLAHKPSVKSPSQGSTYAIVLADQQVGKKYSQESLANWEKAVIAHVAKAKELATAGHKIERAFIGWGGDICEGVANSYTNQAFTAEMNLSTQIEVAYDMSVWTTKYVIDELGLPLTVSSVISNHGETWVRNGHKDPITSRGDNIDTHISRLVRSTFASIPGYDSIDWVIAEGNPRNVFELSGIKVAQTHNYVEKGAGTGVEAKTLSAMQKQILGDPTGLGDVRIWLCSHYHHLHVTQDRNYTLMMTPALEAKMSSEWLFEMSGVWSEPGAIGMLVGADQGGYGWSNFNVF